MQTTVVFPISRKNSSKIEIEKANALLLSLTKDLQKQNLESNRIYSFVLIIRNKYK